MRREDGGLKNEKKPQSLRSSVVSPHSSLMKGTVHGKTIELETEPGLPDGQRVTVIVEPVPQHEIQRSEGKRREDRRMRNDEEKSDLRMRTKEFALRIIRLYAALPKTTEAQVIGRQVLRSGTSVGAHYREAYRSRSDAEYIAKIRGGLQELEETSYWLELLCDAAIVKGDRLAELRSEAEELTANLVACSRSAALKDRGQRTEE
jgi:four helix bundle protein